MNEVYIIYDNSDFPHAEQLSKAFEKVGVHSFLRHRDLPNGEEQDTAFVRMAVEEANIIVVVQSERLFGSSVLEEELSVADELSKPGLIFRIDKSNPIKEKNYWQHINAMNHTQRLYGQAAAFIRDLSAAKKKSRLVVNKYLIVSLCLLCIIILGLFYVLRRGNVNEDAKLNNISIEKYQEISYSKTYQLMRECRSAEVTEDNLPFNLHFGMSPDEVLWNMTAFLEKDSGIKPSTGVGVGLPGKSVDFHLTTSNNVIIDVNPVYNSSNQLSGLNLTFTPPSNNNGLFKEETIKYYMDWLGPSYKKYAIATPNNACKYVAVRANEYVAFYYNDDKIEMRILDVSRVDEEIYSAMLVSEKNIRRLFPDY